MIANFAKMRDDLLVALVRETTQTSERVDALEAASTYGINCDTRRRTRSRKNNCAACSSGIKAVPASDRVVTLNHNAPEYKQATEVLPQIIELVRGDNEYGDADPEDKEQRLAELEAGGRLLKAPRARLEPIKALLLPALKYLAKKFADTTIGLLASKALAALLALLSLLS
jgi:hypothetical protein